MPYCGAGQPGMRRPATPGCRRQPVSRRRSHRGGANGPGTWGPTAPEETPRASRGPGASGAWSLASCASSVTGFFARSRSDLPRARCSNNLVISRAAPRNLMQVETGVTALAGSPHSPRIHGPATPVFFAVQTVPDRNPARVIASFPPAVDRRQRLRDRAHGGSCRGRTNAAAATRRGGSRPA